MDKTDYVLNKRPEPASNEMVWAFDLGKGSIGEAVRRGNEFGASLLIPAEFALPRGRECCACLRRPRSRVLPRGETKTAAGRRRLAHTPQTCTRLASFATLPAHAVQLR
jgi:hypothetical protein